MFNQFTLDPIMGFLYPWDFYIHVGILYPIMGNFLFSSGVP